MSVGSRSGLGSAGAVTAVAALAWSTQAGYGAGESSPPPLRRLARKLRRLRRMCGSPPRTVSSNSATRDGAVFTAATSDQLTITVDPSRSFQDGAGVRRVARRLSSATVLYRLSTFSPERDAAMVALLDPQRGDGLRAVSGVPMGAPDRRGGPPTPCDDLPVAADGPCDAALQHRARRESDSRRRCGRPARLTRRPQIPGLTRGVHRRGCQRPPRVSGSAGV